MSANNNEYSIGIYDILKHIEELIEESPRPTFGGNDKRVVSIQDIKELLADVRAVIAEDVRRANGVLIEADRIVEGAENQADMLTQDSENRAQELISNAQANAEDIIESAQQEANQIVSSARRRAMEIQDAAVLEYERLIAEQSVYSEAQRRGAAVKAKAEASAKMVYNESLVYADNIMKEVSRMLLAHEKQLASIRTMLEENRKELNESMIPDEPDAAKAASIDQEQKVQPPQQKNAEPQQRVSPVAQQNSSVSQQKPEPASASFKTEEQAEFDEILQNRVDEDEDKPKKRGGIFGKVKSFIVGTVTDDDDDEDDDI